MKAIPMRGRLKGKRLAGYIWAGPGRSFHKKENYFQLEHESVVSAYFAGPSGDLQLRFRAGLVRSSSWARSARCFRP